MARRAEIKRKTNETDIEVKLDLDGSGRSSIDTGIPFFDHMLDQLARHSSIDLELRARGDVEIDFHHTVEDVGLALGTALTEALGDKKGITRFGDAAIPMNEALAQARIDISGRAFLVFEAELRVAKTGAFDTELIEEFWRAFVNESKITLHIDIVRGGNSHHMIEAIFKSTARALKTAIRLSGSTEIPSTKGTLC